jgi:UDP-N-acetyl-D-galactosamine dehydrogenase
MASEIVGKILSPGDIVIYESTVYPGATEEDCGPVLERYSGLSYARESMPLGSQVFYLGYSPERINPGDKAHGVSDIVKVTSGSTPEIAAVIDDLYASIITAGTFRAASIRVAEAAKVIENTQRDVNIALINELAVIFEKVGIDTEAVLQAAGTKWNFLPFWPGLVGGHCIGVDPYYLTHKAAQLGHNPEVILAGRRINDNMSAYVANRIIKLMLRRDINPLNSRILVLGLTFKENCPDTRNSKVIDMINSLASYKCDVDVYDPKIDSGHAPANLNGTFVAKLHFGAYDAIILAVAHNEFVQMGTEKLRRYGKTNHVLFDLKYAFPKMETDERL